MQRKFDQPKVGVGGGNVVVVQHFFIGGVVAPKVAPPPRVKPQPAVKPLTDEEAKKAEGLIKRLGDEQFKVRDQAFTQLKAMGRGILPILKKHAKDPDLEVRARVAQLIAEFEKAAQAENNPDDKLAKLKKELVEHNKIYMAKHREVVALQKKLDKLKADGAGDAKIAKMTKVLEKAKTEEARLNQKRIALLTAINKMMVKQ